jgi:MurNAc alpha-1-phosphate uridylyltransferase
MRAIILAAGRGERMRPLSDRVPKPLLRAGGASLIERQIGRLAAAGMREIVVNVSHLAQAIVAALGDGTGLGVRLHYSHEPAALETAGGIAQALPWLEGEAFVAVNGDIYCEYDYACLRRAAERLREAHPDWLAHLVLVPNPAHHPQGDFTLDAGGRVGANASGRLTFSGIGLYRPQLFAGIAAGARAPLAPLLYAAAAQGRLHGEFFRGRWIDVGTPQRLAELRAALGSRADEAESRAPAPGEPG